MAMPIKINVKNVLPYAVFAAACVLINFAVKGIPLSIGLYFSFLICGANAPVSALIYLAAGAVNIDWIFSLCNLFEGVFLCTVTLIYRKAGKKIKWEAVAYIAVALAAYVVFAGTNGLAALPYVENPYALKGIAAAVCAAFTFFCFKSVYAALYRVYRCRLREDELLCIAVTFTAAGVGLCRVAGTPYYFAAAMALAVFCVRLFRSPAAVIAALALSLPHAIVDFRLQPLTAYVVISVAALLFANAGKFAAGVVVLACSAAYAFFEGFYQAETALIVVRACALLLACVLPSLPSDKRMKDLRDRLAVKKSLGQTAVSLCRERTGERLYKISDVFREIECAFTALDEVIDDAGARRRMFAELTETCCKSCTRAQKCKYTTVYAGFTKLINAGCVKGKVSLIDLPSDVTVNCSMPTEVINALNGLLAEYRRYMLDAENARSGRALLADQARGVAEVMKNCAVDMCRTERNFIETEEEMKKKLSEHGISCPEIYLRGDEDLEITAVICGNEPIKKIVPVLSEACKRKFILKNKTCFDSVKYIYTFISPTEYDAAFGVAYAIKKGERVSGDTHSVIRINERSFLMVLSDGMGSGEYARKVSATAISLIEAFYRAEMPEGTVLETINKLLSFSRDERFTCIDIAAINLNSGRADFVKIGSPAGIIVRAGEIKVLESTSLPLGILDNLRPTVATETLTDGDIVVFMSDGITSSFNSTPELYEFLQTLKPLNPQNLADKILAEALSRMGGNATDDMTVLCTRIFANDAA